MFAQAILSPGFVSLAGLVVELCILLGLVYGLFRFIAMFLQMRRDIEELKSAVFTSQPRS